MSTTEWVKPEPVAKEAAAPKAVTTAIHLSGELTSVHFHDSTGPKAEPGDQYALGTIKTTAADYTNPTTAVVTPGKPSYHDILVNQSGIKALKQLVEGVELNEKGRVAPGVSVPMNVDGYLKDNGRGVASIGVNRVAPGLSGPDNHTKIGGEVLKSTIVGKDSFRAVQLEVETPKGDRFFGRVYAKDDCEKVSEQFPRGAQVELEGKMVSVGTKETGFTNSVSVSAIRIVERELHVEQPEHGQGDELDPGIG